MRGIFIILVCCFLNLIGTAQNSELAQKLNALNALNDLLPEIETGKEIHKQSMSFQSESPYRVTLTRTTTDVKKGKESVEIAEFHIGFLDKNQVKINTGKKEMQLIFGSGKNDLIKVTENEKSKGYEDDFYILCEDVDNARALKKAFQEIIPAAEKAWESENELPSDFDGLFDFIKSNVGTAEQGEEDRVEQSINQHSDFSDKISLSVEKFDKKGLEAKTGYDFSLGDLNSSNVKLQIKKEEVSLQIATRGKLKYIESVDKDGETKFTDKSELFFETPEQAVLVKKALESLIPLAAKKAEARLPSPSTAAEANKLLQSQLKKVIIKDKTFEQSLTFENDQAVFKITTTKDGKSEDDRRYFDFGDFSGRPDSDIDKTSATVSIKTNKSKKYVQVFENEERKNYDNEVVFYAHDVETHRQIMALLPIILKENRGAIAPGDFDWLSKEVEKISEVDPELTQTIEKSDPDAPCKVRLKLTESTDKKSEEILSEFNLYDIDPRSIEMDVKGKDVLVVGKTVGKDEIIQQYKDNGKLTFQKEISIPVRNIAAGKKMEVSLRKLIEGCKQ